MLIKNRDILATTELRTHALDIIEAGINSVLPTTIMKSAIHYDPAKKELTVNDNLYYIKGRIFVIGGGKPSGLMAETLEKIIGPENITDGYVNCTTVDYSTSKIHIMKASHPVPDQDGVNGVRMMLSMKDEYSIDADDLVICLIAGGGSALMPCPVDGVSLRDKQEITKLLVKSGADIHEINTVRKHLSKVKGGQSGGYFSPATVVSLIISDVIGNDPDVIASGPTTPDMSTFADAFNVLKSYNLLSGAPESVVKHIRRGMAGDIKDTPEVLHNCSNHIIGDNMLALEAMASKARELGFNPFIATAEQKGDTTIAAEKHAAEIIDAKYKGYDVILIGGETTPTLPDPHGKGGRNQHYAAVSMLAMQDFSGEWVVASVGTDGSDFLPDVAGAIVDNNSLADARRRQIDVESHLETYDTNTLFKKLGHSLIETGNTGTNVCDIVVYIILGGFQQ